jgi:hypothetical protein
MQCIYCLQDKNAAAFSKVEHIIPQSFGTFKNNFVLSKVVCDECNKYFGDNLEIDLARDSFEGSVLRYEYKIKKPTEFKSIGTRSRIKVRIKEGFFKGAYAYPEYMPQEGRICLNPLPQIGFLRTDTSEYDYFLLDQIPSSIFFNSKIYNINNPNGFAIIGCNNEVARDALEQKGYFLGSGENQERRLIKLGSAKSYGKIDQKIIRAVAKIGFNYLAYWEGAKFVLNSNFDPIRKYIRIGIKPDYRVVSIDKEAISPDEFILGYRRNGHIILLVDGIHNDASIFTFVSLFNWARYSVCLAKNFCCDKRDITRGHFFSIPTRKIIKFELRHS